MDNKLICDFCASELVVSKYDAKDAILIIDLGGMPIEYASHGAWAACKTCSMLIDTDNQETLKTRAVALMIQEGIDLPIEFVTEYIDAVHGLFFRVRTGKKETIVNATFHRVEDYLSAIGADYDC